jgi:hypothetical protein
MSVYEASDFEKFRGTEAEIISKNWNYDLEGDKCC